MTLLAGLEVPPSGRMKDEGGRRNQTGPGMTHPSAFSPQPSEEEPFPEGRAPARRGRYPGDDDRAQASDDEPDQDAPTDGRQLLGLGLEAGPRPQGDADRLREEAGAALEDRGMDPAAGRGSLPVRPGQAALYDPLTEPCPPTPRADAFAAKAWETCRRKHLNRWTAGQRRKFEEIWYEEVATAARAKADRP